MSDIAELIARLEMASEPDRELDCLIYMSINDTPDVCGGRLLEEDKAPAYTASIDCALTLVPEGWRTAMVSEMEHRAGWHWRLGEKDGGLRGRSTNGVGPTALLAICIAALKARVEQ